MDETYDVIILGTGIKECILSGLLSVSGKKVLHLDRNDYYGSDSASLNLNQLFKKFAKENNNNHNNKDDAKNEEKTNDNVKNDDKNKGNNDNKAEYDEKELGKSKDYSIDLCPKFIMGCGNLVKMLLHTKVTRYLEFKSVGGSFVYKGGKKLFEVPVTAQAALNSGLLGIFQARRYKNFLMWVLQVKSNDPKTWDKLDLNKQTMRQVFQYWKCDENTIDFTGHAVALYTNDDYLDDVSQTIPCLERLQLYAWSLSKFEKSPYIYPMWGLGGLPEGFSRLAAVHGGVYMLRREVEEIMYDKDGKVTGVSIKTEGKHEGKAYCKQLIGDVSYFFGTNKIKKCNNNIGKVARWLCILDHSVKDTKNADSAQIILPTKQTGHKSDIYISVMSSAMSVAPKGRWIAMISSHVFTNDPKKELKVAYDLLGNVLKEFFFVDATFEADNLKMDDQVFITSSMDATTHFQAATQEVMDIYKRVTGKEVDLNSNPQDIGTDAQYE